MRLHCEFKPCIFFLACGNSVRYVEEEKRTVISGKKAQRALPVGQVWNTEVIVTGREQKDSLRRGSLAAKKVFPL